jgi:type IV secretory pathway TraG/TraD family ATPase VirD4
MEFIALFIFITLMLMALKNGLKNLGIFVGSGRGFSFFGLAYIFRLLKILAVGHESSKGTMKETTKNKLFSSFNDGLLIDGHKHRLSGKESFNHFALISRTGGGKTTSFVIPNILKLAEKKNSMVITDISGELYEQTSGYLESKGYKIYVLNPENLDESIGYNPLYYATDSTKIDELVEILVKSSKSKQSLGGSNDNAEFFESGAKSLISILIKVLLNTKNHKHINLANVRFLLNNYGSEGERLFELIEKYSDEKLYYEFYGFKNGNPQTTLSFVTNANIALSPIGINDNLEKLTSKHTINFENFRKEKSVLYIKIPANKQKQYSFLQNIFYHQFFNYMMDKLPSKNDLPIYCLLDEFGNLNLPDFETTVTTIRKYKVSLSIILQSTMQLENKYGKANAETILSGGIVSRLFYSGADLATTEMLSKLLGKVDKIKTGYDGSNQIKESAVMEANEIRTMKDNEALFITANKEVAKLKIKPYYESFILKQFVKMKPYTFKESIKDLEVEYIDLDNV